MGVSDLLSLIGLFLAIIAFLDSSERKFILNKFSNRDFFLVSLYLILVNYLIFYQWWTNQIEFLNYFEFEGFPNTNTWAYFISIILIFWFLYKIMYAYFPNENKDKVLQFYKYLIAKKEYQSLFSYIEKYDFKKLRSKKVDSFQVILLEEIIGNKLFLKETASYNFFFIIELLNTNDNKVLENNFIYSQLTDQNSYTLMNIESPNQSFFKLLFHNDEFFLKSIDHNLRHNMSDLILLNKYILKFYLFTSQKKIVENTEVIENVFLKIIELKKIHILNKYFSNFSKTIVFDNNNSDSFASLFDLIVNQLNQSLIVFENNEELKFSFNIILDFSLNHYEKPYLKTKVIQSLTTKIDSENFIEFRKSLYECWRKSKKENESFNNNIIEKISNY
ncbi:hypothetical protein [Kordia sp.]|uniref:hypothetical protein n=1 Tax=Kordia sp. TaxID=1965332 RepID=UPI003D2CA96E